jgi:hypothetical protein
MDRTPYVDPVNDICPLPGTEHTLFSNWKGNHPLILAANRISGRSPASQP